MSGLDEKAFEIAAEAMYNKRHEGMRNCYAWDNPGIETEHPGVKDNYRNQAEAAIRAYLSAVGQKAGTAEVKALIQWAHDTLYEINPSNYDHDEVCKLNDASVEVILGLARFLGEKHGHTEAWWAEWDATRSALIPSPSVAEAAEPVTRPSVLTIVSEALSDATDVLKAVHDWQAGSEILPIDLWTQVRDFLRKAGRI